MNPKAETIVSTFRKLYREGKASEVLVTAEKTFKEQKLFQDWCSRVSEARDMLIIIFRACGEVGDIKIAKKYFHKALKEDGDAPSCRGFSPYFNIPYTVSSKPTSLYESVHKGSSPMHVDMAKLRYPMLNTATCNMYLHALSSWNLSELHFDEVRQVRSALIKNKFAMNALTYQYLIEMHFRAGLDVAPLWWELRSKGITPTLISLKTPLSTVIIKHPDPCLVVDVLRVMFDIDCVERNVIVNAIEALCRNDACSCEQAAWALFEVEQHCTLEKIQLMDLLESDSIPLRILVKAAKTGNVHANNIMLAFLERHSIPRTHEVFGLSIYALARNGSVNDALDLVNQMGMQGLLDGVEAQKKFSIDSVDVTMEYHYLYVLAITLSSSLQVLDDAYFYLEEKYKADKSVTIHALDLIILACARLSDEQRAMDTVDTYTKVFDIKPRVLTYLYLIQSCGKKNKSRDQKQVFDMILKSGLRPTTAIYKLLIKQALAVDNIDEALQFLEILAGEHLHDNKYWNKEENIAIQNGKSPEEETVKKRPGHRVKLEPDAIKLFLDKALEKQDATLITELLRRSIEEWGVLIDMKYLMHIEENLFQLGFKMDKVKEAIKLHTKGFLKVPESR